MRGRVLVGLGLSLLLTGAYVPPAAGSDPQSQPSGDASGETDLTVEAARFRAEMGLQADDAYIGALAESTAPSELFGIPLTAEEESLLLERVKIQSQLRPLKAYERDHADMWGGMWLTYPSGSTVAHASVINISLVGDRASLENEIAKLVPDGAVLAIHSAKWTEADLDSRHLGILADDDFFESLGTQLYSVGTSVPDNVLDLELSTTNASIEQAVEARFPAGMVRVVVGDPPQPDACSRTNCGPPWRGGLKIFGKTSADGCTSGFTGRYYTGIWNYVLLTGGHCQTATWHLGSAGGTTIGTTASNYFRNGADVDVQTIPISSSRAENHYLYGSSGCTNCTLKPVAEAEPPNGDTVGELVLANGAWTGSSGGTLLETNRTYPMPDPYRSGVTVTLTHMRRASYTRHKGDSGGPVLRAHYNTYGAYDVAAGQHTDWVKLSGTVYSLYTHVAIIETTTGYDVYTTP